MMVPQPVDMVRVTNHTQDGAPQEVQPGVTWVKTNYDDVGQLTEILRGVDTVLSFIVAHLDPGSVAQKNLINAAVRAGVRRLAPSEWVTSVISP
jgi:hypothetical protein